MQRILFRCYGFSVYSYTAFTCLAILLAIAYALASAKSHPLGIVLDAAIWTLLGGLVAARLAYVLSAWNDYVASPASVFSLWGGGLVFQGGLMGGAVALFAYAVHQRYSYLALADLAAPGVALAQGIGWIGALLHGANYGLLLRSPISMWLPDLYGVYGPRFPTQVIASAYGLLLCAALHKIKSRHLRPGSIALLYIVANSSAHLALEFFRGDETRYVGALRFTQVAEMVQAMLGGILLLYLWQSRDILVKEE